MMSFVFIEPCLQDLQVKSSPPVQPVASVSSIDNDPAIIQVKRTTAELHNL